MRNFIIDLGNTASKLGVFEDELLAEKLDDISIEKLVKKINAELPDNLIIGSVSQEASLITEKIDKKINCISLNHKTKLPITNNYDTKKTLGVDRIAAVVGANKLFPNRNSLVIDSGTCITYDFIDAHGEYQGGAIAPGIHMKFKAIHKFTAKLPLISPKENVSLTGKTTEESILSGVLNGTIAEINEMIRMYASKYANLQIIICGGGAEFYKNKLKENVTFVPDLVLIGLNRILTYNVEN